MHDNLTDDLIRRAELFNEIVDIVQAAGLSVKLTPATPLITHEGPKKTFPPTFVIIQQRVLCNGTSVDLSRRPVILHLLKLFLDAGMRPLTREEIITGLYGHIDDGTLTFRYRQSIVNNVVKVISRARHILSTHFTGIGVDLDWLVYDYIDRVWFLYRPRPSQIFS